MSWNILQGNFSFMHFFVFVYLFEAKIHL